MALTFLLSGSVRGPVRGVRDRWRFARRAPGLAPGYSVDAGQAADTSVAAAPLRRTGNLFAFLL